MIWLLPAIAGWNDARFVMTGDMKLDEVYNSVTSKVELRVADCVTMSKLRSDYEYQAAIVTRRCCID